VRRHAPEVQTTFCADAADVVKRTQVVIAATTSAQPVVPDDPQMVRDKLFISIGSYKPTMQELPDAVYRLAGVLAVDSPHACHEAGDVINSLRRRTLDHEAIYSIGEVVVGRRAANSDGTRVYKAVGAAVYDLFVAQAMYEAAKSRGAGLEVAV
jgi:ornithine cyclodeaminase/alanine dehydrogenase-like protein (mu-crystallin family)